jgi:hypothetical protein
MEQHPIPQQISTYQFRLIGDMTLRQFSQLAGGVIVAIFFYSLPIISFIKWLLVLFFGFLGFALAFLPLEDRPLDRWIVSFFKSIYSPSQFVWKKQRKIPEFLKETPKKAVAEIPSPAPAETKTEMAEYLKTLPTTVAETEVEKGERLALERIEALFKATRLPAAIQPQPRLKVIEKEELMPQIKVKPRRLVVPPTVPVSLKTVFLPITGPKTKTSVKPLAKPKPTPPLRIKIKPAQKKKEPIAAKTSTDLPIPSAPTQANVIVGMVLDPEGKIIENAIVEIRDKDSIPVRALRTNRLGQFQIVTPLANGTYEIEIEKENLQFDIIKLNLTGQIIQPIEIRAKQAAGGQSPPG